MVFNSLLAAAALVPAIMAAPTATSTPTSTTTIIPTATPTTATNTTQTFIPVAPADSDKTTDVKPASNITMLYGAADASVSGKIDMSLDLSIPTVLLETLSDVVDVACPSGKIEVTFANAATFNDAATHWGADGSLAIITNHGADCDLTEERGFFTADNVVADAANLLITVDATRVEISEIAHTMEMNFARVPAASGAAKRITLEDGFPVTFGYSAPPITLYDDSKYLDVKLDEASVHATITFSGKLNFSFVPAKVNELFFDLDIDLDSKVEMSVNAHAQYSQAFEYAPSGLSTTLTSIPGIISLGPGLKFAVGADIDVSAAASVDATVTFGIPDGKIHWDILEFNQSNTAGWDVPEYSASLIATETIAGNVDPYIHLDLELAFELFNKLDLSSGVGFRPVLHNQLQIIGEQGIIVEGTGSDVKVWGDLPSSCDGSIKNGVAVTSDLTLAVTGFVGTIWKGDIFNQDFPLGSLCYAIPQVNTTIVG